MLQDVRSYLVHSSTSLRVLLDIMKKVYKPLYSCLDTLTLEELKSCEVGDLEMFILSWVVKTSVEREGFDRTLERRNQFVNLLYEYVIRMNTIKKEETLFCSFDTVETCIDGLYGSYRY